jgi:hypothetical protein
MSNYSKNKKIEKAFNAENMNIQTSSAEEANPESMPHTARSMSLKSGTFSESS